MPGRSAPLIRVTVRNGGNTEKPLDISSRVLSLTYTDSEQRADKLTLEVDNYDLSNFDDPIWRKGNIVSVSWGYAGNMTPAREVIIHKVAGFDILRIEGLSKSMVMNKVKKSRTFENVKRSDVVRQIARENNFTIADIRDTEVSYETLTQPAITDAQLLARFARQEGFEFYVDHTGFHFHPRNLGAAPLREIKYFNDPNQGDVLGISVENDVTAKPGRVRKRGRDPIKKETIDVSIDNASDSNRKVISSKVIVVDPDTGASSLMEKVAEEEVKTTTQATQKAAEREATGRYRKTQMTAVKMNVTMIGDPLIAAKSLIVMSGVGNRLSGRYYLKEVVHILNPDGYTMGLKAVSDGHGGYSGSKGSLLGESIPLPADPAAKGKKNKRPVADNDRAGNYVDENGRILFVDGNGRTVGEYDPVTKTTREVE